MLSPINNTDLSEYFVDREGFLWRRLLGIPRNKGNTCYLYCGGRWFVLLKPSRCGKYKNYLRHHAGHSNINVARSVLTAFLPIEGMSELQANHKDRNTFNNEISNLEWVTNQENCLHRFRTTPPCGIEELYEAWERKWEQRHKISDLFVPKKVGGTQKYDKDMILELLANTKLSLPEIAVVTKSSLRAVRYWQEKEKIKRYTLLEIVELLCKENPPITNKEIAIRSGSLITSVNSVLRKVNAERLSKG